MGNGESWYDAAWGCDPQQRKEAASLLIIRAASNVCQQQQHSVLAALTCPGTGKGHQE